MKVWNLAYVAGSEQCAKNIRSFFYQRDAPCKTVEEVWDSKHLRWSLRLMPCSTLWLEPWRRPIVLCMTNFNRTCWKFYFNTYWWKHLVRTCSHGYQLASPRQNCVPASFCLLHEPDDRLCRETTSEVFSDNWVSSAFTRSPDRGETIHGWCFREDPWKYHMLHTESTIKTLEERATLLWMSGLYCNPVQGQCVLKLMPMKGLQKEIHHMRRNKELKGMRSARASKKGHLSDDHRPSSIVLSQSEPSVRTRCSFNETGSDATGKQGTQ